MTEVRRKKIRGRSLQTQVHFPLCKRRLRQVQPPVGEIIEAAAGAYFSVSKTGNVGVITLAGTSGITLEGASDTATTSGTTIASIDNFTVEGTTPKVWSNAGTSGTEKVVSGGDDNAIILTATSGSAAKSAILSLTSATIPGKLSANGSPGSAFAAVASLTDTSETSATACAVAKGDGSATTTGGAAGAIFNILGGVSGTALTITSKVGAANALVILKTAKLA